MTEPRVVDRETMAIPESALDDACRRADKLAKQLLHEGRPFASLSSDELAIVVLMGSLKQMTESWNDVRGVAARAAQLPKAWRTLIEGSKQIAKDCEPDSNAAGYWRGFMVALNGMADDLERTLAGGRGGKAASQEG